MSLLDIDPEKFQEIMNAFNSIASKDPADYDLGELEGDYEDCPDMFNYPDFSQSENN